MSHAPGCIVVGSGRIAGGYLAPLLRAAGWDVTLACRSHVIRDAVTGAGGLEVQLGGAPATWVDGVCAADLGGSPLVSAARTCDLIATAVGPSSLDEVGRRIAPLVRARLDATGRPLNIITFENHRRAPEMLVAGLIAADPGLAADVGRRLGIGGAAVWRAVASRVIDGGRVRYRADDLTECHVDGRSLVGGAAPLDPAIPGVNLVDAFEAWIIEKLWVFNAGHAAAAYLGWHAGCGTMDEAMAVDGIRDVVGEVVAEAQIGLETYLAATPGAPALSRRDPNWILERYADPALADTVTRVAREPRRKLSPGDRMLGPAVAAMAAGHTPVALATAISAGLAYAHADDGQASDLQFELELLGPEEVLATVAGLDPVDELTRLIAQCYRLDVASRVPV